MIIAIESRNCRQIVEWVDAELSSLMAQARGTEMLRLPGEDAIVSWPNAKETIIAQRDQYMARTLYAAATGN